MIVGINYKSKSSFHLQIYNIFNGGTVIAVSPLTVIHINIEFLCYNSFIVQIQNVVQCVNNEL